MATKRKMCTLYTELGKRLNVDIYNDGKMDIVTIIPSYYFDVNCPEHPVAIPFYTDLTSIPVDKRLPSCADDRNENWDWLIHFRPNIMFTTREPKQYLQINSDAEVCDIKIVILSEEDGTYTMGVYYVDEEIGRINNSQDEIRIHRINYLVQEEMSASSSSHLWRSLSKTALFINENNLWCEIQRVKNRML